MKLVLSLLHSEGGFILEQRKHVDFVSAIVFIALATFMIFEGFSYHSQITQRLDLAFYESPGFFPVIVGAIMLICSIMLLTRSLKGGALKENIEKIKSGAKAFATKQTLYSLVGIAIMGTYVFLLLPFLSSLLPPGMGFIAASVIFLVGIMLYLKAGHIVKILLVSGLVVGISYIVVQMIFRAPLP